MVGMQESKKPLHQLLYKGLSHLGWNLVCFWDILVDELQVILITFGLTSIKGKKLETILY